ncbi:MAG: EAL domain-containing protein [Chitinophagaceae bacterium]|nr:EAL domain-containing protein [Oligoflexus sp.]
MILIANKNQALTQRLESDLTHRGGKVASIRLDDPHALNLLYSPVVTVLIVDESLTSLPREGLVDLVNSLGRRISVIVLAAAAPNDGSTYSDYITVLDINNYEEVLSTAIFCFSGLDDSVRRQLRTIPYYNHQIPVSLLNAYGGLGILTLDASGLNKISVEYGTEVYNTMKTVLHDVMVSLWGGTGSLRENDIICRKSMSSNTYIIFMDRSRETGSLPFPGALERVADRLSQGINNAMWKELFLPSKQRRIPECVQTIPLLGVGYFGVLNNPCIDIHEIVENGLESSRAMAQSQLKRGKDRQRELMATLIQADDFLTPHYQGVFMLQSIDKKMIDEAKRTKSIQGLSDHIYGFESLIRVNQAAIKEYSFEAGIDSQYLRPDVLFAIAKYTNVALELDQACMKHAARFAKDLPGTLMVNILPRNLYHIDSLLNHFDKTMKIMFEVSESEAINNLDLMMKAREHLQSYNMGIAADDFGKGYSSLDRIIKIRPDIIKFDRGMIQDIDKDPVKQAYVQGLVTAAKILNTTILAEGVETWNEAQILKDMGIELIQGFLLHKPEASQSIQAQLATTQADGNKNTNSNGTEKPTIVPALKNNVA